MTQHPEESSELNKQKSNTVKRGGTIYMRIPPRIRDKLSLDGDTEVEVALEKGPHGKYMSTWNPNQQGE